ncbi:MAG: SH3 domain-containing protein [Spirochaetales bacterium]|nr:SH3 domain-containing protein [Spirochaetales bacterium]
MKNRSNIANWRVFFLSVLLLIILLTGMSADTGNVPKYQVVTADVGLKMRDHPDLNGNVIDIIPYRDVVECIEIYGKNKTIGGATGYWTKVIWCGLEGWVFGGYLSENFKTPSNIESLFLGKWIPNNADGDAMIIKLDSKGNAHFGFYRTCAGGDGTYIYDRITNILTITHELMPSPGTAEDPDDKYEKVMNDFQFKIIMISKNTMLIQAFLKSGKRLFLLVRKNEKIKDL